VACQRARDSSADNGRLRPNRDTPGKCPVRFGSEAGAATCPQIRSGAVTVVPSNAVNCAYAAYQRRCTGGGGVRDEEAGSSNLPTPTKATGHLRSSRVAVFVRRVTNQPFAPFAYARTGSRPRCRSRGQSRRRIATTTVSGRSRSNRLVRVSEAGRPGPAIRAGCAIRAERAERSTGAGTATAAAPPARPSSRLRPSRR
jgi:hypothetical protein